MEIDWNYRKLFSLTDYQLQIFENLIYSEPKNSWELNTYRQDRRNKTGVHKDTKALIFIFKNLRLGNIFDEKLFSRYSIIKEIFIKASEVLNIKDYIIDRCLLVNLPTGKKIREHNDNPAIFGDSHRIHVPLITAEECEFVVGNEKVPMIKGTAIEINNLNKHSVDNKSNVDRIHLIFDIRNNPL